MAQTAFGIEPRIRTQVEHALRSGCDWLLAQQSEEGWWKGELATNVTMDAEDLLLREFLGIRTPEQTEQSARWIRSQQRDDGTWASFYGGPGNLSVTVEAYAALRLAGDSPDEPHMRAAAQFVRDSGGVEHARVFTHLWLALFGLWSWDDVPALPPEIIVLPKWAPFNLYDFACWARQTVAALTVVWAHRPARKAPFNLHELHNGGKPPLNHKSMWGRALTRLDRFLHAYERLPERPFMPLRRACLERAESWIVKRQEADGSWGGIQPPWVYSLMALHLQGYPIDHAVMQKGLDGLDRFTIVEGGMRRLEACQSPVWDTALTVLSLSDAGVAPDHPQLVKAGDWLVGQEVRVKGDWAVRRPKLQPGGWAFEFENDNYPDTDDTAEVVMALRRVKCSDAASAEEAIERGIRWAIGMQSSDGGWAAFDVDNKLTLCRELPFCDFGEVIDPPSADVTAHVVEMLADVGLAGTRAAQRGVEWLTDDQKADGSWFGRWGANHVYGVGAALPALIDAGVPKADRRVRRAVGWLERHQNADGGWGEDLRSYDDPEMIGLGASTASQTAWAVIGLLAAGERSKAVDRGVEWLIRTQREDGTWDEPWFTGTGFPGDFYINYHLYRQTFPLMALGRYVRSRPRERDRAAAQLNGHRNGRRNGNRAGALARHILNGRSAG